MEISNIVIFILGYIFGAISAVIVLRKEKKFAFEPKQIERIFIFGIITGIWAVSNAWAIFTDGYESPTALHALFGAVVGFYFDLSLFDRVGVFSKKIGKK